MQLCYSADVVALQFVSVFVKVLRCLFFQFFLLKSIARVSMSRDMNYETITNLITKNFIVVLLYRYFQQSLKYFSKNTEDYFSNLSI